jgi:hypothetical protein
MNDPSSFGRDLARQIKTFIAGELRGIAGRLDALEARAPIAGPTGERGEKGDSGSSGEPGPRGEPGPAGRDGERGEKGDPGADGRDGVHGRDGDRGEKGESGINGRDGAPGRDGEKGEKGDPGADGRSVSLEDVRPIIEAKCAEWALDFERRAQDILRRAIESIPRPADGRDGKDGKDGADGLGFDDFDIEYDGERSLAFRLERGERLKSWKFDLPVPISRGVFKPGETYKTGDGVTYSGSYWIALRETDARPGEGNDHWRLSVKRGRDGKDGKDGAEGKQGPAGRPGRDLTQLGSDGSKWS